MSGDYCTGTAHAQGRTQARSNGRTRCVVPAPLPCCDPAAAARVALGVGDHVLERRDELRCESREQLDVGFATSDRGNAFRNRRTTRTTTESPRLERGWTRASRPRCCRRRCAPSTMRIESATPCIGVAFCVRSLPGIAVERHLAMLGGVPPGSLTPRAAPRAKGVATRTAQRGRTPRGADIPTG